MDFGERELTRKANGGRLGVGPGSGESWVGSWNHKAHVSVRLV